MFSFFIHYAIMSEYPSTSELLFENDTETLVVPLEQKASRLEYGVWRVVPDPPANCKYLYGLVTAHLRHPSRVNKTVARKTVWRYFGLSATEKKTFNQQTRSWFETKAPILSCRKPLPEQRLLSYQETSRADIFFYLHDKTVQPQAPTCPRPVPVTNHNGWRLMPELQSGHETWEYYVPFVAHLRQVEQVNKSVYLEEILAHFNLISIVEKHGFLLAISSWIALCQVLGDREEPPSRRVIFYIVPSTSRIIFKYVKL